MTNFLCEPRRQLAADIRETLTEFHIACGFG
jgi:hypothetical protein